MMLLKSKTAWKKWAKGFNAGQPQRKCEPPVEFPCFVYTTVASFGYEEEAENYIYEDDIKRMFLEMTNDTWAHL